MTVNWVRATYSDVEVQDKAHITTLVYQFTDGRYNVYQTDNGDLVVIFANQRSILDFTNGHEGSVFLIRYLREDNNKYKYTIKINEHDVDVITIARVAVLIEGTKQFPRSLSYPHAGSLLTVE